MATVWPCTKLLNKTLQESHPNTVTLTHRPSFGFPFQPAVKVSSPSKAIKKICVHIHNKKPSYFKTEPIHNPIYIHLINSSHIASPSLDFYKAREKTCQQSFCKFSPAWTHLTNVWAKSSGSCPGISSLLQNLPVILQFIPRTAKTMQEPSTNITDTLKEKIYKSLLLYSNISSCGLNKI